MTDKIDKNNQSGSKRNKKMTDKIEKNDDRNISTMKAGSK